MPNFDDSLNQFSRPLFQAVNNGYIPSEYVGLTEGMTGFNSDEQGAFSLNAPIAGVLRDLLGSPGLALELQPTGDRFILRGVVGYALAVRILGDVGIFTLSISSLINGMLGAAYKVYGPRIVKLTFDRPGLAPEQYFIELENTAGYEVRLYGELAPAFETEDANGTLP